MVTVGERIAGGAEADVFAAGPGRVVKLWRDPAAVPRAAEEARRTELVAAAGVAVVAVHGQVTIDGRPGLLLDRIEGSDLARLLAARPWTVDRVAAELAGAQVALHARAAPAGVPDLHDVLVGRLDALPHGLRDPALRRLDALPAGDRLLHGNLHLANAVRSPTGPVLVDWGDVSRGAPVAEVAHTLVRYRLARLRAEAPGWVHAVSAPGRALLRSRYLHHYQRLAMVDLAAVAAWLPVRAAERLAEGNADEEATLLALVGGGRNR
ncbi:MAG: aminoglycoside phosphotransferase [Frankiales bacterium]|nr:aminoglycoside phosphotransferase [Frankiales bacterium]